jgi:hypothetical protein
MRKILTTRLYSSTAAVSSRWLLAMFITVSLWSSITPAQADRMVQPLTRKSLSGTWTGVTENKLWMIKLTLNENGTGSFALVSYSSNLDAVHENLITSWVLDGDQLKIESERKEFDAALSGKAPGGHVLDMELKGPNWVSKSRLYSDSHWKASVAKIDKMTAERPK